MFFEQLRHFIRESLSSETAQVCMSNFDWHIVVIGSTGTEYDVQYGLMPGSTSEHGYSCNCEDYRQRHSGIPGRYCKHIKEAILNGKHCRWNKDVDSSLQSEFPNWCPECGGPLVTVKARV